MRQNCPSITDKGTQTLTFDAQLPHELGGILTQRSTFVCSKVHTVANGLVRMAQVNGPTAGTRLWRAIEIFPGCRLERTRRAVSK